MLSEPFHIRLQSLMASRKLTQSELARRMGVGRVCVNYWYWGINEPSIGTLRSLGASDQQITRIFVIEGWLIALVGAVLGVLLGLVLCFGQQHYGWLTVDADPQTLIVHAYPVAVQWTDVLLAFLLVAAIGLLTALVTSLTMRRRLAAR